MPADQVGHPDDAPDDRPAVAPSRGRRLAAGGLVAVVVVALAAVLLGAVVADPDADASDHHGWHGGTGGDPQRLGRSVPGVPTVQRVQQPSETLTVAVGPGRPGANVVRVDVVAAEPGHGGHGDHAAEATSEPAPVRVGVGSDRAVEARPLPGTEGLWARVDLPAGEGDVVVEHEGRTSRFAVDTGSERAGRSSAWAGADAPECLSAAVARTVAGSRPAPDSCPSDRLGQRDARDLAATVDLLGQRGVRRLALHADDSPRGAAAARVVRDAAARGGVEVVAPDAPATGRTAVLDVAGWSSSAEGLAATAALPREQQPIRSDGTWLAPWLLSPSVVGSTPGAVLPLSFDIRDDGPVRYAATLRTLLPGQAPTASGYRAWAASRETPAGTSMLYAASRANFMSSDMGHPGHETQIGWFPGGTITPVSALDGGS